MSAGTLLVLVSPTVAALIAFWGFRRTSRADRMSAFFRLHDQYLRPEIRTGRRMIHEQVSGRSAAEVATLSAEDRAAMGYTLAVMNSIAIACEAGYVDLDVVDRSMGRSFRATVRAAEPFIEHLEAKRGFRPYGYAERLAAVVGGDRSLTARARWRWRPRVRTGRAPDAGRADAVELDNAPSL